MAVVPFLEDARVVTATYDDQPLEPELQVNPSSLHPMQSRVLGGGRAALAARAEAGNGTSKLALCLRLASKGREGQPNVLDGHRFDARVFDCHVSSVPVSFFIALQNEDFARDRGAPRILSGRSYGYYTR
eukprot:1112285-Pyramimonas_sp.AAC.1